MQGTGSFPAVSVLPRGGAVVGSAARLGGCHHRGRSPRPIPGKPGAAPGSHDLTCAEALVSSGMMRRHEAEQGHLRHMPEAVLSGGPGASEASGIALPVTRKDVVPGAAQFSPVDVTVVDPDTLEPLAAGSGATGVIAKAGALPPGCSKDPERRAMTWRIIRGVPGRVSGEHARLRPDATITLPGRGHHCINPAGEKVCPDGAGEVLKPFPRITGALVFGETDARPGQRVAAVVPQKKVTGLDALASFARQNRQTRKTLAGPGQDRRRTGAGGAAPGPHPGGEETSGIPGRCQPGRPVVHGPARPAGWYPRGRPARGVNP